MAMKFSRINLENYDFDDPHDVSEVREDGTTCSHKTKHIELLNLSLKKNVQAWKELGSPYYKIWPAIASQMASTSIDIDMELMKFPFPAIEISMPHECKWPSMMVFHDCNAFEIGREDEPKDTILIVNKTANGFLLQRSLSLIPGETFQSLLNRSRSDIKTGLQEMLRIVICTCFFAVENHEVIMPDIKREVLERKYPKARGKRGILAEQRINNELAKWKGWKVGSEIDLPRPHVIRTGQPQQLGNELTSGHMRSGHMRMQACGVGLKDRKLIFVPPTLVRPDLPMRTMHGYRIQDNVLSTGKR